jgi:hypothetical protein
MLIPPAIPKLTGFVAGTTDWAFAAVATSARAIATPNTERFILDFLRSGFDFQPTAG